MRLIGRLSVRTLILSAFAAVIGIAAIAFGEVGAEVAKLRGAYEVVKNESLVLSDGLLELRNAAEVLVEVTWSGTLARIALHTHDAAGVDPEARRLFEFAQESESNEVAEARERLDAAMRRFADLERKHDHAGILAFPQEVQEIESRVEQIMADSDKVSASAAAGEYTETRKLLVRIVATGEDLAKLVQVTIDGEREALTEKDAEVAGAIEDSVSSALFGGGLAVAVGFIAAIFISRRVAAPLRDLRNAAGAIGEGKFDVALPTNAGSEVGELARSFHEMAGRLKGTMEKMAGQERLSVLGQMAGTVSHELRNPLATIGTSLHTLRHTSESKGFGIERMLDRIERSIERCNGIVADLLDYARVRELNREATALDRFLGEVLDEHPLPDSVVLERDLGAGVDAMLDCERFRRVMINLLDNAAQAMTGQGWTAPDGRAPTLTVRAEVAGPHIRVSVADNGPGIKAELLARIFEPLFTTKSRGVGLGLPLVRQIVEQHGGTIDVESRVDAGTTFTIFLPRQPAGQQADSAVGRRHAA